MSGGGGLERGGRVERKSERVRESERGGRTWIKAGLSGCVNCVAGCE